MLKPSWSEYYKKVITLPHHPKTEQAAELASSAQPIAIDCGCGTGRDSAYLLDRGFQVYAFDIKQDAVEICQQRFEGNNNFSVTQCCFSEFHYPQANLILANSSLFFCPEQHFPQVWLKLTRALLPEGIVHVDLVGEKDSWVNSPHHSVSAFKKAEIEKLFSGFEILSFKERDEPGKTAIGNEKHWHTYSVLARKNC